MKFRLPKIKIFQRLISLRYLYILIVILTTGVTSSLGSFLYKNFYQTITQSEEIILLKKEVAPDAIDIKEVENIINNLNKKTTNNNIDWETIKNPFGLTANPKITESEKTNTQESITE